MKKNKQKSDLDFDLDFDLDLGENSVSKNAPAELTDEIRSMRQRNKEFAATNEHETYLILVFSCKDDKIEFCDNTGIVEHTLVDGYEFARSINVEPKKPAFALHKPLHKPKKK